MPRSKIAISLDQSTLERLDTLVQQAAFPSRSQAIQEAVEENLPAWTGAAWPRSVRNSTPSSKGRLPRKACQRMFPHGPNIEG